MQYHLRAFVEHLKDDLLVQLIEAGLPFLLRWSLDDNTESVLSATIFALEAMINVPSDSVSVWFCFAFSQHVDQINSYMCMLLYLIMLVTYQE